MKKKQYICIDLKSFYASVECRERHLDPLNTNLVVADASRTNKTICLAVSPSLKMYGTGGRPRLFELEQKIDEANKQRAARLKGHNFEGSSYLFDKLQSDPKLKIDYIVATPRMKFYMDYSSRIYSIYLKYISSEDIHVYSIDEVFIDATAYLNTYKMTAHQLALTMIRDVLKTTGITATAGIGTNMYLAKVAMDIVAKHIDPDEDGVRIAELDEYSFREKLWTHTPLTDFWRIGPGIQRRLNRLGIYNIGDLARCSLHNESLLYKEFGINAELLIDHAWGWEPCEMKDIKSYVPTTNSLSNGQVLSKPYPFKKAEMILKEMADVLSMTLFEKNLVTSQISVSVLYDRTSDTRTTDSDFLIDEKGRVFVKPAHGTINMPIYNNSTRMKTDYAVRLYESIVDPELLVRKIFIGANEVIPADKAAGKEAYQQMDLFSPVEERPQESREELEKDRKVQKALLDIRKRYGANSVFKGLNKEEDSTALERNNQVGGHRA